MSGQVSEFRGAAIERSTAAPHPEEMKLSFEMEIGRAGRMRATIRTTPAGLIATGLMASSIVGTAIWLSRRKVAG